MKAVKVGHTGSIHVYKSDIQYPDVKLRWDDYYPALGDKQGCYCYGWGSGPGRQGGNMHTFDGRSYLYGSW